jgi:hypothetical protein
MSGSSPNIPGRSPADVREMKALKSYSLAISAIDRLYETAIAGHDGAIEILERIASDLSTQAETKPSQITTGAIALPSSQTESELGQI